MSWVGIFQFAQIVDELSANISPDSRVTPWKVVVVQQNPEDVAFDLSITGFGLTSDMPFGLLRTTESWISTGLWHIDQIIHSQLLLTWAGLDFASLTVWLPSFAEAVLECWPSSTHAHLRAWFQPRDTHVFVFVYERWGWSLVSINTTEHHMIVTFLEPAGHLAVTSRILAQRAFQVSGRKDYEEQVMKIPQTSGQVGSLVNAMTCFHQAIGLTSDLVSEVVQRADPPSFFEGIGITPAASFSQVISAEYESSSQGQTPGGVKVGLTAGFLLRFARALSGNVPSTISSAQIQVLCIGQLPEHNMTCHLRAWEVGHTPLFLFVWHEHHWTFVRCELQDQKLKVVQYDGLAQTPLSALAPLCATLKRAWNATTVSLTSTWIIEQTRSDSCGTVALGHFALQAGLISYEQAMHFEELHPCFAACSSLLGGCQLQGFGPDEKKITDELTQILPSKGVPEAHVKDRIQAAMKIFGADAIGKTLQAANEWAALKQLGNSRPKPFMWVTNLELQEHIKERSQKDFGVDTDIKRKKHQKDNKKKPFVTQSIDPASLVLIPDVFITNSGDTVPQISLEAVCDPAGRQTVFE